MWLPFFPLKMVHWNLGEAETWRRGSEQTSPILRVTYRQRPFRAFRPGMPMKLLLLAFDAACNTALSGMRGPHGNNVQSPLMRVRSSSSSRSASFPGVLEWTEIVEGVEEEMVGFLEQSSVEIKGEAWRWVGEGSLLQDLFSSVCQVVQSTEHTVVNWKDMARPSWCLVFGLPSTPHLCKFSLLHKA